MNLVDRAFEQIEHEARAVQFRGETWLADLLTASVAP
jgi:hypothetical protein